MAICLAGRPLIACSRGWDKGGGVLSLGGLAAAGGSVGVTY